MTNKIRVGVIFGGRSAEHEVSLQSAKNVVAALDPEKYEVTLIGITKQGKWLSFSPTSWLENTDDPKKISFAPSSDSLGLIPLDPSSQLIGITSGERMATLDVAFPVLHGPYGEDGTIQGLLKLLDIPFVGPSVLGSAVGMDKDVMKRLLRDARIPVANFLVFDSSDKDEIDFESVQSQLGLPVFVKPANMGSSVGISKVKNKEDFSKAIETAFRFDTKILIEESIQGREIECSVLGNENPIASIPGEIIPHHEFYSYDAKYIDGDGAGLEIPAKISSETIAQVQRLAIKTFKVLCCEGLSRVDLFLTEAGELLVNEINTIPGFTKISMYPKLWEASGVSYEELIDRLIQLAIERHERDKRIQI